MLRRPGGFSVVETLTAVAVAGLIGMASWAPIGRSVRSLALRRAVHDVQARLHAARFGAAFRGTPMRVRFAGESWRVDRYESPPGDWRRDGGGLLEGASVSASADPVFYPAGAVAPLASIVVSNAAGAYKITIAITGRLKTVRLG